jgi:folate-dependent phosphoribosylglycinamide formyltransferase PurN
MRVGIVASSDSNLFASTLVARLIQQNHQPTCIILAEEPRLHRLFASIRVAGWRETLRKIARSCNVGRVGSPDIRFYLDKYAARESLTNWDNPLSTLAADRNIELVRVNSLHDEQVTRYVRDNNLDLLINAAGVIFRRPLLEASRLGMLNAHMGQLPEFRGMNVLEWGIWNGRQPGITIHFLTPGIDLGDILAFRPISIDQDDTVASLRCKSYPVMIDAMVACVTDLCENRATCTAQALHEGRQYFVMHPKLLEITELKLQQMKSEPSTNPG